MKNKGLIGFGVLLYIFYAWMWLTFPELNLLGWQKCYFLMMLVSMGVLIGYYTKIIAVKSLEDRDDSRDGGL